MGDDPLALEARSMLTGSAIVLRAPCKADIPLLFTLRNDLESQMLLGARPRANSPERVGQWLSKALDDPNRIFFVIADRHTNDAVGYIELRDIEFTDRVGELGICLITTARGRGAGSEALRLLETYVQDIFNIRKIILHVLSTNVRAITFYERCGYFKAGVLREHFFQRGLFHDVTICEKLLREQTTSYAQDT